jgi:hypothetical protein
MMMSASVYGASATMRLKPLALFFPNGPTRERLEIDQKCQCQTNRKSTLGYQ